MNVLKRSSYVVCSQKFIMGLELLAGQEVENGVSGARKTQNPTAVEFFSQPHEVSQTWMFEPAFQRKKCQLRQTKTDHLLKAHKKLIASNKNLFDMNVDCGSSRVFKFKQVGPSGSNKVVFTDRVVYQKLSLGRAMGLSPSNNVSHQGACARSGTGWDAGRGNMRNAQDA